MPKETEVVSLRVHPETRALLEKLAKQRGFSLAALLQDLAEGSVSPPTQLDFWAEEVEQILEGLGSIRDTEALLELGPRKLEDKVLDLETDLEDLLDAIEEERKEEEDE